MDTSLRRTLCHSPQVSVLRGLTSRFSSPRSKFFTAFTYHFSHGTQMKIRLNEVATAFSEIYCLAAVWWPLLSIPIGQELGVAAFKMFEKGGETLIFNTKNKSWNWVPNPVQNHRNIPMRTCARDISDSEPIIKSCGIVHKPKLKSCYHLLVWNLFEICL